MKNAIKYLYQLITIYVGLLIPDIVYYFFLIYVFKEKLDKNWGFSTILSISMLFNLVMLILIFISFNLITNNKKLFNYKFNYWFVLSNSIIAETSFIFFGRYIGKFTSQFYHVLDPFISQFIILLVMYYIVFFVVRKVLQMKNPNFRQ